MAKLTPFLVAGAIGFAISLLIGLIAGNPFGTVLLRSLLSGLGTGAALFGLSLLLKKFLPELFKTSGETGEVSSDASGMGEIINIVSEKSDEDSGFYANQAVAEGDSDNMFEDEGRSKLDEVVEEVTETNVTALDEMYSDSGADLGNADSDEAGELPDISGFESSFQVAGTESDDQTQREEGNYNSASEADGSTSQSGASAKSERLPNGMDPQLIAKALSTALKRSK